MEKEERAKKGALMMFLKHEMSMKKEDIEQLNIFKIFPPAKDEWNTLYVELATWEMAEFTRSFTTFMRCGTTGEDRVEVVKYIPRDLFIRFKAINSLGNQARLDSNKTTSFRTWWNNFSFGLRTLLFKNSGLACRISKLCDKKASFDFFGQKG